MKKGMMIWKIKDAGTPEEIARRASEVGFSWVAIKATNGYSNYNLRPIPKAPYYVDDIFGPTVDALRSRGISVWGWGYVYGFYPYNEAMVAINRIEKFDLDGWMIDAEVEYYNKNYQATRYMSEMRKALPNLPMGLCSYRFPSYHPQIPWKEFLEKCDYHFPQVYWQGKHNPDVQLQMSVRELYQLKRLPVVPVGAAYTEHGWTALDTDLDLFDKTAKNLGLPGVTYWEWSQAENLGLMDVIKEHDWGVEKTVPLAEWALNADEFLRTLGFKGPKFGG